jgi:type I restriction enzyme R subunit
MSLDWCKRLPARAQVMISIEQILDEEPPKINEEGKFNEKCQLVFRHIYNNYVRKKGYEINGV